ncbi:hypothetical protein HK105_201070 [Polyrhizophydium stewartii]|uniref:Peptidase A1 domain-containing protein n=1 Tax=Polyrhizophydium stewartii TaxID=2732419 RepID=A0ABR4NIY4_9FUNG|nr:hypothetical protein HK105_000291 [Polyrhizophydium stewartii]
MRAVGALVASLALFAGAAQAVNFPDLSGVDPSEALPVTTSKKTLSVPFKSVLRAGAGSASLSATSQAQALFVTVQVGTPPVDVNVLLDTGSPTFWINSALCKTAGCSKTVGKYNPSSSSTASLSTSVLQRKYGDGTSVTCSIYNDNLSIAGVSIPKQPVCVATALDFPNTSGLEGLIGLGPPHQTDPAEVFSYMRSSFPESKVSFYYNRQVAAVEKGVILDNAGEVTFGVPNAARYTGSFNWLPIDPTADHWTVPFTATKVDGSSVRPTSAAIVDTGTTLVYLDSVSFALVNSKMRGLNAGGVYQVDCANVKSFPPITFTLGGVDFTLTWDKQFFVLKNQYCISIFSTIPGFPTLFGAGFIRQFYTSFDYANSTIGFAKLAGDDPTINIPGVGPSGGSGGSGGSGKNSATGMIAGGSIAAAMAGTAFSVFAGAFTL